MADLIRIKMPFLAAMVFVTMAGGVPAMAADLADEVQPPVVMESAWEFEVTPYFWAPGLKGDTALFGAPPVKVDAKFHDLFDAIDWAEFPPVFMGYGEVRRDRFGVYVDLIHFALEVDAREPGPLVSKADLKLKATVATALGSYRVIENDAAHLDLLAGARLWNVDGNLAFRIGPIGGKFNDDETWVDPVIGAKGQYGLSERFFLKGWGMIGGFGVSSDFMWDVFGGVGYQVTDRFSTTLGWRHIGVDYSSGAFLFDVDLDGPMIEGSLKF